VSGGPSAFGRMQRPLQTWGRRRLPVRLAPGGPPAAQGE